MSVQSRLFCLALAFFVSACQTEDKAPQPRFVSDASDTGKAVAYAYAPKSASHANASGYFIEFRSRYALSYGHTYVVFGRAQNGKLINPEVAGLHPSSNSEVPYVLGHFIPVPAETGWSDGDLEEGYRSASWTVVVSQSECNDVVASIRKLQASSPVWHAALYNCNAFVADIARSMGYKTPPIQLRPQQFVTELGQMNTHS
jgi:hypothetical protein